MKKLMVPLFFFFISLMLIISCHFLFPTLHVIPFPFHRSGILLSLGGFIIMGKTNALFKKHRTPLAITQATYLLQHSVFSKTRNPMYIGMFLFLAGLSIFLGNLISLLIPLVFIVLIHFIFVLREEKLMYKSFGQDYLDYRQQVRRWI